MSDILEPILSVVSDEEENVLQHCRQNETSEFCRHLGAWRANEATGLGESVSKDILDFESSLKTPAQSRRGRWEEVRSDSDSDGDEDDRCHKTSSTTLMLWQDERVLVRGTVTEGQGLLRLTSSLW
jgi:hypothetical protein